MENPWSEEEVLVLAKRQHQAADEIAEIMKKHKILSFEETQATLAYFQWGLWNTRKKALELREKK